MEIGSKQFRRRHFFLNSTCRSFNLKLRTFEYLEWKMRTIEDKLKSTHASVGISLKFNQMATAICEINSLYNICIVQDLHKLWSFAFHLRWDLSMFFVRINVKNNCITQSSIFKSDANLSSFISPVPQHLLCNIFATWNLIYWKWKLLVFHLSTCAMTATTTTTVILMSKSVSCSLSFVFFSFYRVFTQ